MLLIRLADPRLCQGNYIANTTCAPAFPEGGTRNPAKGPITQISVSSSEGKIRISAVQSLSNCKARYVVNHQQDSHDL